MMSVRGIPCVSRRSPDDVKKEKDEGEAERPDKRENAIGSEAEKSPLLDMSRALHRVGSCFIVIKCFTRSGILKNTFQTKVRFGHTAIIVY